jgi:hypothetical protein
MRSPGQARSRPTVKAPERGRLPGRCRLPGGFNLG